MIDRARQLKYALVSGAVFLVANADAVRQIVPEGSKWAHWIGTAVIGAGLVVRAFGVDPSKGGRE